MTKPKQYYYVVRYRQWATHSEIESIWRWQMDDNGEHLPETGEAVENYNVVNGLLQIVEVPDETE